METNMKTYFAILFSSALSLSMHAAEAPPQFEFYNKSSVPVRVHAEVGNTWQDKWEKVVDAGKKFAIKSLGEGRQVLTLSLYFTDQNNEIDRINVYEITPINKGETVYLSFSLEKKPPLYPQTGRGFGLFGVSDSGYPLDKNIKRDAIRLQEGTSGKHGSLPGFLAP